MANHGMSNERRRRHKNALRKRDGNFCQECRRSFTADLSATIEHRIPRSQGGTNARDNLELLCLPCNQARGRAAVRAAA